MYSKILENCRIGANIQRLIYWNRNNDETYGFPVLYNQSCIPMFFDPWSGQCIVGHSRAYDCMGHISDVDSSLFSKVSSDQKLHIHGRYCTALESHTRFGERGDSTIIEIPNIRVVGVLNKELDGGWSSNKVELFFRRNGYQALEEWEFSGWTPMQYCPFCGAQLPSTLENELTDILQKEYGLSSWEDYKKAPQEFHTDEWWRKRGL